MEQKNVPLLEFDGITKEKFTPADFYKGTACFEKCVISFSKTATEATAQKLGGKQIAEVSSCSANLQIYLVNVRGEGIALVCGMLGSAGAAAQLEELIHLGAKKFVVCGAAGTLTQNPLGALVVVERAVRDEGASFHYAPPSYEIEADKEAVASILATLKEEKIPASAGKTWTTDGLYRETEDKIELRRAQGCVTVEMEASALIAAARFRGVKLGQILYCGDDLSGDGYDHRAFFDQKEIRQKLTEWALLCVRNF